MAKRVQRQRTKGYKMPPNTVIISRPSRWGNPYTVEPVGHTEWVVCEWGETVTTKGRSRALALARCLELYRMWAEIQIDGDPHWLEPLRGKDLACWCKEGDLCHGDILLALLEGATKPPPA